MFNTQNGPSHKEVALMMSWRFYNQKRKLITAENSFFYASKLVCVKCLFLNKSERKQKTKYNRYSRKTRIRNQIQADISDLTSHFLFVCFLLWYF